MLATLLKALFLITMPVVLFAAAGYSMMHLTGRDQFRSRKPEAVPLNFRASGYDAPAANAYWNWLGPDGRKAEQRFLEADLAFPFLYGGAMLASLLLAWAWLGRPFSPLWLLAPVAITIVADWIENLVHWHQLRLHAAGEPLQAGWIQAASVATTAKLGFFWLSAAGVVVLAVWLALRGSEAG